MSSLTNREKLILEKIFEMDGGYVLVFTNKSFQRFIFDAVRIDIYQDKYSQYGDSKANRLRKLFDIEDDDTVAVLIHELLDYWKTNKQLNNSFVIHSDDNLFNAGMSIYNRLLGIQDHILSEDDFLGKEFGDISLKYISIDSSIIPIINLRLEEINKNLKSGAFLSAIIMIGSTLEGLLLGYATSHSKRYNQSLCSPKDKLTGKVLKFQYWTLNDFIDVSHNIGFIGLDVKKFSHVLRDFRNFIHPYHQLSMNFTPDKHTAQISWQVLQAAIADLSEDY